MNPIRLFLQTLCIKNSNKTSLTPVNSLYDIEVNSISNEKIDLHDFKGKYILFVNVASKCGFTPQYKELQTLNDKYSKKLVIIGVPCNQFGNQEPGNSSEIERFCSLNYGVTFLITEKIIVKGSEKHPLYKWLTDRKINGYKNSTVKWNFQKYLIDPEGKLVDYFYSVTSPTSSKITQHL